MQLNIALNKMWINFDVKKTLLKTNINVEAAFPSLILGRGITKNFIALYIINVQERPQAACEFRNCNALIFPPLYFN